MQADNREFNASGDIARTSATWGTAIASQNWPSRATASLRKG
jgi:hypothetical protein